MTRSPRNGHGRLPNRRAKEADRGSNGMLNAIAGAFTSRAAGPAASAVAVVLAVALAVSWSTAEARRTALERRIADLTVQAERSRSLMKAQLAACQAATQPQRLMQATYGPAPKAGEARRLLEREPEGIDACARMESADRAVLSNLK